MTREITAKKIYNKIRNILLSLINSIWGITFIRKYKIKINLVILKHKIKKYLYKRCDIKLIIGASGSYQKGWLSTNQELLDLLKEDDWRKLFNTNSINAMLAEHVWEHLTYNEGLDALKRCLKYLKTNGYLRLAVPDAYHPNQEYIKRVKPGAKDHKVFYNYKNLSALAEKAGFRVKLLEYFNENGEFKYNDWSKEDGCINRSLYNDERNQDGKINYTSIIIDAVKQ